MFVKFRTFAHFSLRTKHFSAKHRMLGHMKPGRTHWSRSRRDPCTLERAAGAQRFLDYFPGCDTRGLILYVRTSEMSSLFWSSMNSKYLPVRFFAPEHSTQHRHQTARYSSRTENAVNPSCIQHCNPVSQQQHSDQSRPRVAGLHAVL